MADLNRKQFHEMSQDEFAEQPGTYFHGTASGVVGSGGGSFHVGTKSAATQALGARLAGGSLYSKEAVDAGDGDAPYQARIEARPQPPVPVNYDRTTGKHTDFLRNPDPKVIAGRIVSPMANNSAQPMGDWHANGRENQIKTKGQTMRQGIYYRNEAEDSGSISAIIPDRSGFKTHEDYLVEARARGKKIPPEALKGYDQIPGQQRMVF